jgi:hypothetical protein
MYPRRKEITTMAGPCLLTATGDADLALDSRH